MQIPRSFRPLMGLLVVLLLSLFAAGCGPDAQDTPEAESGSPVPGESPERRQFETWLGDAQALARAGRPLEARALFEKAAEIDRNDARVQRGLRLQKVGPERAAAAQIQKIAAEDALFLGHDLVALQHLTEARQLDPNDEDLESLHAATCLKTRRFSEARSLFNAIYLSDPSRSDAYLGRADAAYQAFDWNGVASDLDDLEERLASGDATLAGRMPQLRFIQGVAFFNLYRFPEAIATLTKAVAASPTTPHFREYLASSQLEGGNFNEAIAEFKTLIELAPRTPLVRYKLGKAHDRLGQKREAIDSYRAELGMNPKLFQVATECARCYDALGGVDNLREAQTLLERALEINPLSHDALFTLQGVEKKLGLADKAAATNGRYLELTAFKDDREEEMRVFERRRKNDPKDREAWLAIVEIKARYSPPEEVLEIVRDMLNALPRDLDGLYHLVQLFLVTGNNDEAWLEAAKMIDYAPQDPRGFALGATALIRLNRHREALPLARRALVLDDGNGDALDCLVTALQRLEPDSEELKALIPLHEHMREQQRLLEEELRRRKAADPLGR